MRTTPPSAAARVDCYHRRCLEASAERIYADDNARTPGSPVELRGVDALAARPQPRGPQMTGAAESAAPVTRLVGVQGEPALRSSTRS